VGTPSTRCCKHSCIGPRHAQEVTDRTCGQVRGCGTRRTPGCGAWQQLGCIHRASPASSLSRLRNASKARDQANPARGGGALISPCPYPLDPPCRSPVHSEATSVGVQGHCQFWVINPQITACWRCPVRPPQCQRCVCVLAGWHTSTQRSLGSSHYCVRQSWDARRSAEGQPD